MITNMCMHCLEEGLWEDEDKCPKCAEAGHISPWQVSQCPECNKEFFDSIDALLKRVNARKKIHEMLVESGFEDIVWSDDSEETVRLTCIIRYN